MEWYEILGVSVEPPPKQGCEAENIGESVNDTVSQWNPRRSRGASAPVFDEVLAARVSVEPPPKQGCEMRTTTKRRL